MLPTDRPIVALAPMDGVTDRAYRQIVRRLNPDVWLYSEFTSINGIEHSAFVRERLRFENRELPFFVQIFGREPELFAKIIEEIQDMGITGVDINMGCPSKRIVKAGNGASLIKEPELAFRIVEAAVKVARIPITVKTRIGWNETSGLMDFAKGIENAGAELLTLHGRTARQMYRGQADWEPIYEVKKALSIPVIGNGDVTGKEIGEERLKGLDGYMIGRASVGNPWVFWPQEKREQVTLADKVEVMLEHYELLRGYQEEKKALIEFRKHLTGYISGYQNAKAMRQALMAASTEAEFIQTAKSLA